MFTGKPDKKVGKENEEEKEIKKVFVTTLNSVVDDTDTPWR